MSHLTSNIQLWSYLAYLQLPFTVAENYYLHGEYPTSQMKIKWLTILEKEQKKKSHTKLAKK